MDTKTAAFVAFTSVIVLVAVAGLFVLGSASIRNHVTWQLSLAALLVLPVVELAVATIVVQFDAVGMRGIMSGELLCSSLHGGSQSGCTWAGAAFEGLLVAGVLNVASAGMISLAAFVVVLAVLAVAKAGLARRRQLRMPASFPDTRPEPGRLR